MKKDVFKRIVLALALMSPSGASHAVALSDHRCSGSQHVKPVPVPEPARPPGTKQPPKTPTPKPQPTPKPKPTPRPGG